MPRRILCDLIGLAAFLAAAAVWLPILSAL